MKKKGIFLLLFVILIVSLVVFVESGGYIEPLTVGYGNTLFCRLTGCKMKGDLDMDGNSILNVTFINVTETSLSIIGDLNVSGNSTADYFFGIYDWIIKEGDSRRYLGFNGTDLLINETEINQTIDAKLLGMTWIFVENYTQYGTVEDGNITLLQDYDGKAFNITEEVPNALLWYGNTTDNVSDDVSRINIRYMFNGNDVLTLYLKKLDGTWESYLTLGETSEFDWKESPIDDPLEHLIDGKIVARIEHVGTAKTTHKLSIDQIKVTNKFVVTTTNEIDPDSIHKDNTQPPTTNIDWDGFTIYNVSINGSDANFVNLNVSNNITANAYQIWNSDYNKYGCVVSDNEWVYVSGDCDVDSTDGLDITIPSVVGNDFSYGWNGLEEHKFGTTGNDAIIYPTGNALFQDIVADNFNGSWNGSKDYLTNGTDANFVNTEVTNLNVTETASINKLEDTSLVGWWQMSGNANDSSIYGNDGNVTGAVFDKDVVEFDGTGDYISLPSFRLVNFTVGFWVKLNTLDGWAGIFSKGGYNGVTDWYFSVGDTDDGNVCMARGNDFNDCSSSNPFGVGNWYYVLITSEGSDAVSYDWIIYKDGVIWFTIDGDTENHEINDYQFCVGSEANSDGSCGKSEFNGVIDEVKIYNRALSSAEILQLYNEKNKNFGHFNEIITDSISFDTDQTINISYDGNFFRFDYNSTIPSTLARFSGNISTTGLITRTTTYDKSKNVWDYVRDSDYYLTNGEITHSKFYGYAPITIIDFSRPVIETINCMDIDEYGKEFETNCNRTTYPHTTIEEGISLNKEIDLLRQAVYELNQENQMLEDELCQVHNNTYSWCK